MKLTTTQPFELATRQTQQEQDLLGVFILNRYPNEGSAKAVVTDLRQLNLWLQKTYQTDLFEVKATHLGIYRKTLETSGYKVNSINRKLSSIKSWFRYLAEVGYNKTNKAEYLRLIKNVVKVGTTEAFELKEVSQMFESFDTSKSWELRNKVICAIMFYCAARVSAVLNLKFEDVLREASGLKLRLREKNGKVRLLHCNSQVLAPSLLELIERLPFDEGFIFRGYRKGFGWTEKKLGRQNCYAMVRKQTERLDFKKRLSNHSFRCGFATAWLEKNYSINSLKKIGGWANLDTVKRYDRNSQEASISEMELLRI